MSFPTTSKGSSISHHLRATKKILLDAISDARYVWNGKDMPYRRTEIQVRRIATTLDKEEVKRMSEMDTRIMTDVCCILGQCSRTRNFRDPPPDWVLEKHARTNQQDPSRSPRYRSRFLGSGIQRSGPHRINTRMPGMEGGVRIVALSVEQYKLRGREKNSRLSRTLKILPHQFVTA